MKERTMNYPFHEAANIFPLDEEHLDELVKDIRKNGQKVPVELIDGEVIDGRRRCLACNRLGIEPITKNVTVDDPITYVLSLNLHRRHLTVTQAAMCAARAEKLQEKLSEQAKERQKRKPDFVRLKRDGQKDIRTRDQLGEMFGVSGPSVDRAKQVLRRGVPELIEATDAGKVSVNRASHISTMPEELQKELLEVEVERGPTHQHEAKPRKAGNTEHAEGNGKIKGVGVIRAHEALNCLIRIPKDDPLRKRGFQIVTDWIRHNK